MSVTASSCNLGSMFINAAKTAAIPCFDGGQC